MNELNFDALINTPASLSKKELIKKISWALLRLYILSGKEYDKLRIRAGVEFGLDEQLQTSAQKESEFVALNPSVWPKVLENIFIYINAISTQRLDKPDPARLPILAISMEGDFLVIKDFNSRGEWIAESFESNDIVIKNFVDFIFIRPSFVNLDQHDRRHKTVFNIFKNEFLQHKTTLIEIAAASILINLLALGTSLYSMQVYDRVIPTQGYSTLQVLTAGVLITIIFDFFVKLIRSHLMRRTTIKMDGNLSRQTFAQLLNIRLDQLPSTVGSLSGQLRGYETIRGFVSSTTIYILVDVPFAIFYIFLVGLIGSPIACLVPLFFLVVSLIFGVSMRSKASSHASMAVDSGNQKTGLLVEAIEGAETIKSGSSSWRVLSKWIDVSEKTIFHDMSLKAINEKTTFFSAMFQQVSSIGLVAVGAYLATLGDMTMGSLIACTILSGRALAPMSQIPSLMVQAASAKAALDRLEKVFALEVDNHNIDRPLLPTSITGRFLLEDVKFHYKDSPDALIINKLNIQPGEKVGIIGPVGAGKSTLLRLLTGMFKPNSGLILIDDLDICQLSRGFLSENIGYLQQDHRLFNSTLRDNLLIGMADPGDEMIKKVAEDTGLLESISRHPKGLDMVIAEGGKGLSGGQRQLVALTRLLLTNSRIWLLDEPTASMDTKTEQKSLDALKSKIKPEHTLLLVTHKLPLLSMVDRVICILNHHIVLDGPRDEVLKRLAGLPNRDLKSS